MVFENPLEVDAPGDLFDGLPLRFDVQTLSGIESCGEPQIFVVFVTHELEQSLAVPEVSHCLGVRHHSAERRASAAWLQRENGKESSTVTAERAERVLALDAARRGESYAGLWKWAGWLILTRRSGSSPELLTRLAAAHRLLAVA